MKITVTLCMKYKTRIKDRPFAVGSRGCHVLLWLDAQNLNAKVLGNVVISKNSYAHTGSWWFIAMRGESVSTYPRRLNAEALAQHGWCSRTSSRSDRSKYRTHGTSELCTCSTRWRPASSDLANLHRRVSSARRHGDGDDDASNAGLRLSTTTIWSRWIMVEGGTAHG